MSAVSAVAGHASASEKVHAYEDNKEQDENPVLSDPVHFSTSLSPFKKTCITALMKIVLFSYCFQIFTAFSKAELLTTDNELIAIAAAAMIGLSKPKAAMGMAAVL